MIETLRHAMGWRPALSFWAMATTAAAAGAPAHYGDWPMDGILPEGVAFEASDPWIVAGVYEYDGPEPRRSDLAFWRVDRAAGKAPCLIPTAHRVPTAPGAHALIVVNG